MGLSISATGSGKNPRFADGYSCARKFIDIGAVWASPLRKENTEYYDGDLDILSEDGNLDLIAHKGLALPYPVTFMMSKNKYVFCRSWNHIREDKVDVVEVRYVQRGTFSFSQRGNASTVSAGQFIFIQSSVPHRWESLSNDQTQTEFFFILLPLDLVFRHFPEGIPLGVCLPARPNQGLAMPGLFSLLYEQGVYLSLDVINLLIDVFLKEAREVVIEQGTQFQPRKHICDKRMEDITAYIALHFSNPDITLATVAQACGISPRYLCYLFKTKGISFSDLLWGERIKKAREWLVGLDAKQYPISEVAFMAGFKTAAHFSRLFRNHYGCSPRAFRIQNADHKTVAA